MILAKTTLILDEEQSEQLRRLWNDTIPHAVKRAVVLAQPYIVVDGEFVDPMTVSVAIFNASATAGLREVVASAIQAPLDPSDMLPPNAEKGGTE